MYIVYALKSDKDQRIYVGISQDVFKRLKEHNRGQTRSTKVYRPWRILHVEYFNTRLEARLIEKKWKSGSGKEYLKSLNSVPVAQLDRATAFNKEPS